MHYKNNCMAKLFKKLQKIDKQIKEKKSELSETKDPLNGYYLRIGSESERQRDIKEIEVELKSLYSQKYSEIESIEIELQILKADISYSERKLTLSIIS